jgi:nucleoside-diphosphate-sugar epimerase
MSVRSALTQAGCVITRKEVGTVRLLVTGGTGVLGRAFLPLAQAQGQLDGPGTGHDQPNPALGASLHTEDAGRALLAALTVPSGIYNVCRDGERVSNRRFAEAAWWRPLR